MYVFVAAGARPYDNRTPQSSTMNNPVPTMMKDSLSLV
jgi:hypothetical protein